MEKSTELESKLRELEEVARGIPNLTEFGKMLPAKVEDPKTPTAEMKKGAFEGLSRMEFWDIPVGQALVDGFSTVFAKELIDGFLVKRGLLAHNQQSSEKDLADAKQQPSLGTSELIERFLESKRGSINENSLMSYRYSLQVFAKHCPILPLTPEALEAYLARYENRQTAHDIHAKLGLFYRFLHGRCGLPNVMQNVQRPRVKRQRKSGLTLEEARAIVEACQTDRELGLIHLYLGHGLRREEALRLNIGDIGDGSMYVTGKTANEPMPLLPETKEILLRLAGDRKSEEPIFMSQCKKRLSHQMVNVIVRDILLRVGITRKGISCHALRHTFATLMTEYGLDEISCRRLMRHADSSMTERYVHLNLKPLRSKLERYSPLRLIKADCQKLDKMLV
jgi:integrase